MTEIDPAPDHDPNAEAIATRVADRIVVRINREALIALIVKELRDGGWVKPPLLRADAIVLPEPVPEKE